MDELLGSAPSDESLGYSHTVPDGTKNALPDEEGQQFRRASLEIKNSDLRFQIGD
jgi:hypothetical protein